MSNRRKDYIAPHIGAQVGRKPIATEKKNEKNSPKQGSKYIIGASHINIL